MTTTTSAITTLTRHETGRLRLRYTERTDDLDMRRGRLRHAAVCILSLPGYPMEWGTRGLWLTATCQDSGLLAWVSSMAGPLFLMDTGRAPQDTLSRLEDVKHTQSHLPDVVITIKTGSEGVHLHLISRHDNPNTAMRNITETNVESTELVTYSKINDEYPMFT
ncbi:hypothetical protein BDZ89DRAFT_1182432 [Hymenopellis radicata]|nr:hypothetical protein BDZ89DRAFT_1182432 [Hymenopellis radicata]